MKRFSFLLTLVLLLTTSVFVWCPAHAQGESDSCAAKTQLCWPRLQRGTHSPVVTKLQQLLRARGYTTVADGKFGYGTETTVRKFQGAHHLKQDGVVGWQTWEVLVPILKPGSRGASVRILQTWLNSFGNSVPKVRVDGVYGAATRRAVLKLHDYMEVKADTPDQADAAAWCYLLGGTYALGD